MRRVKAEGGWGVVCTEQAEIHPTSEITPFIELAFGTTADMPMLARIADVHEDGALAGIELATRDERPQPLFARDAAGAVNMPILTFNADPSRRAPWTGRTSAISAAGTAPRVRAKQAGFDLVCFYGAHGFGTPQHFLSRGTNQRTDEYGGSLENRARLLRRSSRTPRTRGRRCAVRCDLVDEVRATAASTSGDA